MQHLPAVGHRQSSDVAAVERPAALHVVAPRAAQPTGGCPSWCTLEHLGEGTDSCGFHHDGEVTTLNLVAPAGDGAPVDLFVNISQHACPGGRLEDPYVEVQDGYRTLALLTVDEAVELAAALLASARVMGGSPAGAVDAGPVRAV